VPQKADRITKRASELHGQAAAGRSKTMNTNITQQPEDQAVMAAIVDIRHISEQQLAQLGLQQIAYVKPVDVDGTACFAIHAADGTPMAIAGGLDVAFAAIRQHEMVPAQVH
jgi:hypothetical protein